ncbi:hypothetical protein [Pseudoalteromonas byunsanensis]|uniref:Uncharacterized protein n=1 Tax=Pseudoalteromonas byunsanensis TaxID=327939 RepID=A0A1S1MYS9_9GAMM|nr:hypothetical protein [Pseudoalteromonas byunsanensis]OHU94090.1 hypothetical protein BIW53_17915 [Pseudoalteromonas byunsanensis]
MKVNANQLIEMGALANKGPSKSIKQENTATVQNSDLKLAADTYHGAKEQIPDPTYSRPIVLEQAQQLIEEPEQTSARLNEAYHQLYFNGDMYKAADELAGEYNQFMSELASSNPQLAQKDWAFSVDEEGAIKVSGQLSADEVSYLEDKLNENEKLVQLANDVKDNFLKYTELERGPSEQGTSQYWGKYDVSNENFAEIIDMRSLMKEQIKEDEVSVRIGNNLNMFGFIDNMSEQLSGKAQATYAA